MENQGRKSHHGLLHANWKGPRELVEIGGFGPTVDSARSAVNGLRNLDDREKGS
jgi:hypothetical protein